MVSSSSIQFIRKLSQSRAAASTLISISLRKDTYIFTTSARALSTYDGSSFSLNLSSITTTTSPYQTRHFRVSHENEVIDSSSKTDDIIPVKSKIKYSLPKRVHQKIISAADSVNLIRSNDTIVVSGFVTQGCAELVLEQLGKRFEETNEPANLTLLFGGGPGDYNNRGLSHLAKKSTDGTISMLRRAIGGHYGQAPRVAELVLDESIEGWTLPMGSISRMIRAQSTHSPGHITTVGIGTYVDPDLQGGAANDKARQSEFHKHLVSKISINGESHLMYKALPIDVAIIRGTTADAMGNITVEHESLLCDQRICAAAAKNSGGIVIAQVKRIAANGTIPARDVAIPAPFVDCVVVVDDDDHNKYHPMSYITNHDPSLTYEIRTPANAVESMEMDIRKVIARRAFFNLKPNKIINLGIGIPDGVAAVAAEEGMLDYITLSTEPGVFGGLPASGHNFGPSYNAQSLLEMNQMFDYYDGGGLDMCFLGAAQISSSGDVNVSRMSKNRLTGPGGFINISQCTKKCYFMLSMTTKGLNVSIPGDGTIQIVNEGNVKKFVNTVYEITFSGNEAVRRGQEVLYITERAVFTRTAKHTTLELIEIAPGIDLQKDVLDQMDFIPIISKNLKIMDPRLYQYGKMKVLSEIFGSLESRFKYDPIDHIVYFDMFGITLNTDDDIIWFDNGVRGIIQPIITNANNKKINMIVNYNGFDLQNGLETLFLNVVSKIEKDCYESVKRYTGHAFQRIQLKSSLSNMINPTELFTKWDIDNNGYLSFDELRNGFHNDFHIQLTPTQIHHFMISSTSSASSENNTDNNDNSTNKTNDNQNMLVDITMFTKGLSQILK